MKMLLLISVMLVSAFAQANDAAKQQYLQGYADQVFNRYNAAYLEAQKVDAAIQAFAANPSQELLDAAKAQWIESRKVYSVTEVYRFFDGPIDGIFGTEEGPEGLINSWPMDEAYVDYVTDPKTKQVYVGGIVNDSVNFPDLSDVDALKDANGDGGETNVATGWHAIEFILWGQDLPTYAEDEVTLIDTKANRPLSDFTTAQNADRRLTYLKAISQRLVSDIGTVVKAWVPNSQNYRAGFVEDVAMFEKVIEAARYLAGNELAVERMNVALDSGSQEDEHSCFSDTTHFDIYYNFVGVKNVVTENYNGVTFLSMTAEKNPALATEISNILADLEVKFLSFPAPFDVALTTDDGRAAVQAVVAQLQLLGNKLNEASNELK